MNCVAKSKPIHSIPRIKGVRNPQAGHKLRVNVKAHNSPLAVMKGMILGQYTDHASGSFKPLILGRYIPRYIINIALIAI